MTSQAYAVRADFDRDTAAPVNESWGGNLVDFAERMQPVSFSIERATRGDVPAILDITNWAAANLAANFATEPESLESWLAAFDETHERYPWLVARDAAPERNELLGFAKAGPFRTRGAYAWTAETSIYIHPTMQRRGVGKALYGALIPTLKAQGYLCLFAGVTSPHPPSEGLHAACGFRKLGTFHRCGWKLEAWRDVGFWELVLDPSAQAPPALKPVQAVWQDPRPMRK